MISDKRVIAIIPARGGSKGLPNKNIKILCGKPLIYWSIYKASLSKYLDKIIVSTDSKKIAKIAKEYDAEVPFLRPNELSTDTAPTFDAVNHALSCLKERGELFDYVVLLEPTSPLREDYDIDKMLLKLHQNKKDYDSIISIGKISEHPSIMKKIVNGNLEPFEANINQTTRRQDNIPAYFPFGVAYITKIESLLLEKTFYTKRSTYYEIKRYQNYEIDDVYDFYCVEKIMQHEWGL